MYTSRPVDLNSLPLNLSLNGLAPWFDGGIIEGGIQSTFDMRIAFDGASGSQPYVDVKGNLSGLAVSMPGGAKSQFSGTATSATVQGWTAGSGAPIALIEQYLNLSNYKGIGEGFLGPTPPESTAFGVIIDPGPETAAPEPGAPLAYLSSLAAVGLRCLWAPSRERRRGARPLCCVGPWRCALLPTELRHQSITLGRERILDQEPGTERHESGNT